MFHRILTILWRWSKGCFQLKFDKGYTKKFIHYFAAFFFFGIYHRFILAWPETHLSFVKHFNRYFSGGGNLAALPGWIRYLFLNKLPPFLGMVSICKQDTRTTELHSHMSYFDVSLQISYPISIQREKCRNIF